MERFFAILMTSILFGLFHENLYQLYFASFNWFGALAISLFEYFDYLVYHFSCLLIIFVIAVRFSFSFKRAPEPIVNIFFTAY